MGAVDVTLGGHTVLDRPRDPDLQALAEIAAGICDVPIALVNLLDDAVQHSIAAIGVSPLVCTREDALCAVTVAQPESVLVVPDARADPRFAANPFVDGRSAALRFYAAARLTVPDGTVIGTLCVFDLVPRTLSAAQRRCLQQLADQVVDVLELRRRTRELREAVAELTRARAELVRTNEHLAAFAGQIAHDLRGPLTGVLGWVEALADSAAVRADPDVAWTAGRATAIGQRMQAMLQELLDYARVGGAVRRDRVELADVLADVVEDLRETLGGARVEVGPLPAVLGDATALRAVLANLLDNAAKYAVPARLPCIRVSATRSGQLVRVEVVDNGVGIPAPRRERALRPLARVHDAAELGGRDPGGTGMGLATCVRVVEAHGGDLELADAPGGGTRVVITLPAAP